MRRFVFLMSLVCTGCGGDTSEPAATDRELIQGDWRVVRYERGGAANVDEGMLDAVFSFTDDRLAVHTPTQLWAIEEGFSLEPHHFPPRIIIRDEGRERDRRKELPSDWINEEETIRIEQGRDRKLAGIYRFDADNRLTLCFIKGGESTPWLFDSTIHRECLLMVLEKLSD
jgi:uncharacterized protein (TIGR03067 family)